MKFSRKKDSKKSTEEGSTSIPTVSEKVEEEDLKKRKKKSSKKGSTSGKKEIIRLKYIPHKADVPRIYLLIKHSHSSGSEYFSRCFYMMFALV